MLQRSGGAAIAITEACPHIRATVIELPTVLPVTKRFIEEAGATERVQVMSVDVVNDPLPGMYDVAVLRALIQVLSPDNALQALSNIGAAINPGGRIYIVGRVLDNSRLTPVESLGINLVFLNHYDDGHAYTEDEHRKWLTAGGFEAVERISLPHGLSIVTARKPT